MDVLNEEQEHALARAKSELKRRSGAFPIGAESWTCLSRDEVSA